MLLKAVKNNVQVITGIELQFTQYSGALCWSIFFLLQMKCTFLNCVGREVGHFISSLLFKIVQFKTKCVLCFVLSTIYTHEHIFTSKYVKMCTFVPLSPRTPPPTPPPSPPPPLLASSHTLSPFTQPVHTRAHIGQKRYKCTVIYTIEIGTALHVSRTLWANLLFRVPFASPAEQGPCSASGPPFVVEKLMQSIYSAMLRNCKSMKNNNRRIYIYFLFFSIEFRLSSKCWNVLIYSLDTLYLVWVVLFFHCENVSLESAAEFLSLLLSPKKVTSFLFSPTQYIYISYVKPCEKYWDCY